MSHVAPRRRIELDSPDMVWRVARGRVSVMVEPAPESGLPRASETLLRVSQGGYVFGVSSEDVADRVRVFLETSPGARLEPMLAEDFLDSCRRNPEKAEPLVLRVLEQLSSHVTPGIPPAGVAKLLKPGGNFRLPGGRSAAGLAPLWFRADTGSCLYGGGEAVGRLPGDRFHPLVGNMWVEMFESGRLVCTPTRNLLRSERFFGDLTAFSTLTLNMIFEKFSELALTRFMRLVDSSRHRTDEFATAMSRAEGVLASHETDHVGGSGVLETVRRVGRELGLKIKEPAEKKIDPEERLGDILECNDIFSREVDLGPGWFREDGPPLIGFLDSPSGTAEPVALLSGRKGYSIVDPETGRRKRLTQERADGLADRALQLYAPLPAGKPGPLQLVRYSMTGCGRELFLVVLMGLLGGLCGFGLPMAMSTTVDSVIANGEYGLLGQIVAGLFMIVLGSATFELTKSAALLRTETRAQMSLQSAMFARVLRLPVDFYRKFPAGDLANRVAAVDNLRRSLSGTVLVTLLSSTFALTNLVLLAVYSWKLALAVFVILSATLAITWLVMKKQMKFQARVQNVIGKLAGLELQLVTGINKLRAAGAESNGFARWMENFAELRKISYAIGQGTNVVTVYSAGLPLLSGVIVFGLFIFSGMFMELSLGSFLCFNAALGQLTSAVAALSSMAVTLMFIKPMYQRAKPILEAEPETHGGRKDPGELKGAVEAVNIGFKYEGATRPTLQSVSFRADPGQFVAIVGPSGSGKSTLLKLLLGFHSPSAGSILYDGKPLQRLDPARVRRQIGSVIQNGELFQGNLFFNIMGASGKGSEEDAWEAARMAAVDEDIRSMPMGMHTFVPHGGGTFSGGQKQRIMIARALSGRPKIFLLDEATSNLDNTTQATVMRNLRLVNATRIVVAHRLSTIRDADTIYVMQDGRVIESGNYEELMNKKGLFTKMAARQME